MAIKYAASAWVQISCLPYFPPNNLQIIWLSMTKIDAYGWVYLRMYVIWWISKSPKISKYPVDYSAEIMVSANYFLRRKQMDHSFTDLSNIFENMWNISSNTALPFHTFLTQTFLRVEKNFTHQDLFKNEFYTLQWMVNLKEGMCTKVKKKCFLYYWFTKIEEMFILLI